MMRFSRLVQLEQVRRTLAEAAAYIQDGGNSELCQELMQNGARMLEQIDAILRQAQADWKSNRPMETLEQVRSAWRAPLPDDMAERLENLGRSLREDIAVQVRAVFFADLGGKWDAMDSVYRYMREDPRFDPVVVLMPVYRAAQVNGETKTEVIYEDYLTGLGIPFQNCWEYDPAQDCPELAFTSQPYESVTLPEFWAQNIAKYTRLVYLPYYIPSILNAGNKKILCDMPIHTYSWRVASSSEKFAYYYRKYSQCRGRNLMVTGIPKMDYAVSLREKPCAVPKEWQSKIEGRVVLLWNTWYDGYASSLDLLQQVLPWFHEHQNFALIWRPHPMSRAVMKLHEPEQYRKLQEMMDAVPTFDNMILDDGVECGPAFSCSSAQISDFSAMMIQYLFLDKPLLWIQKPDKTLVNKEAELHSKWIVSSRWMEKASTSADVIDFMERIARGEDRYRGVRGEVCSEDLPLADGNAATRICNRLWEDLFQECFE